MASLAMLPHVPGMGAHDISCADDKSVNDSRVVKTVSPETARPRGWEIVPWERVQSPMDG